MGGEVRTTIVRLSQQHFEPYSIFDRLFPGYDYVSRMGSISSIVRIDFSIISSN